MPRAVLVQVKRQITHCEFRQYFCSAIPWRLVGMELHCGSLDDGGFMVKVGSFVR